MMKRQWLLLCTANALCMFLAISACKKDKNSEQLEFDTQTSQDNSLAESVFNDVNNISNQAIENGSSGLSTYRLTDGTSLLSLCTTVTVTPDSAGAGGSIDVDFGSVNCLCRDNRYRRGIIHIVYSGAYRDSGTTITHTFQDYYVGRDTAVMYKVTGTKTVRNLGQNADNHTVFSVDVDGHLTNRNGVTMNWTSLRQREWVAGEPTTGPTNWLDDQYYITGSASGTNFEGTAFTANITKRLWVDLSCAWIKEGTFELTPSGKPTRTLDYGSGLCDDKATVTVNNTTFTVTLR